MVHLLSDLLFEYARTHAIARTRTLTVGVVQDGSDHLDAWETVDLKIPHFEEWTNFSKWCHKQGITVFARKKVIDGLKAWWPSVIEIDTSASNERVVMTKMLHL